MSLRLFLHCRCLKKLGREENFERFELSGILIKISTFRSTNRGNLVYMKCIFPDNLNEIDLNYLCSQSRKKTVYYLFIF